MALKLLQFHQNCLSRCLFTNRKSRNWALLKATQDYGSQWNIPDSEGFEEVQTALGGRKRAETGSSVGCSDNHDSKKGRLDDIQEGLVG